MRVVALGLFLLAGCDLVWLDPPPPPPPPPGPDAWRLVDAGGNFTCAIRYDETLWCWGAGGSGQLGTSTTEDQIAPRQVDGLWSQVAAGERHTCAIATDGSLWCWGFNEQGQIGGVGTRATPQALDGPTWKLVETGGTHTC